MIVGNYLFELKKFEHVESLSEETNCFSAVLCVNGRAFADCRNSGQGEMTHIRVHPEHRELGEKIEAFLKTQPKIKPEGYDFELEFDLEYIVDELVVKAIERKTLVEMKKKTKSYLVFTTPSGNYIWRGWKKRTIECMLRHPQGPDMIAKVITEELAKGNTLFNGNIPADLLPDQYPYNHQKQNPT